MPNFPNFCKADFLATFFFKCNGIFGVIELFCVVTVVIDTQLYALVKTHRTLHYKNEFLKTKKIKMWKNTKWNTN